MRNALVLASVICASSVSVFAADASYGTVTMREDRVLVIDKLGTDADGKVSEEKTSIAPNDPDYAETMMKVGSIKPGETKSYNAENASLAPLHKD